MVILRTRSHLVFDANFWHKAQVLVIVFKTLVAFMFCELMLGYATGLLTVVFTPRTYRSINFRFFYSLLTLRIVMAEWLKTLLSFASVDGDSNLHH